ncbi:hypothetical protein OROMI_011499 [Orobanche minor]
MDESKAREARNKRANKLKRKREGKLSGELSLETNEIAYVDGGIATIVPSSSFIPVAIDTSKLHAARIRRFKSNACSGVIADFTSCRTNSDDVPTPPELAQSSDVVLQDGDENLSYRHSNSTGSRGNSNGLQADIVQKLKEMLDENNILVQSFRMARDKIQQCSEANVKLKLIGRRDKDGQMYNLPTASEVAALVVGDFDEALGNRDIIVETKTGYLKRINELHASYIGLQYPLIFPYGEDGYREDISLSITTRLEAAFSRGETNLATQGLPVVLPSSYTGSPWYMIQNFQDAMTICGWAGYPDLFITLTCNPKWPEISRYLDRKGLNPEDRPDIVCRVFRMKLDGLIKDLRKNRVFGRVKAVNCIYS